MYRTFLLFSAAAAFLAVALGAFGAHGLRDRLDEHFMAVYQTAVQYQFWHALGLGLVAVLAKSNPGSALLLWAGGGMIAGMLLFCGSLFALVASGNKALGMITPFGGLSFLAAWLLVAIFAWRSSGTPSP